MGCATSSPVVKTQYVPVDNPRVVCGDAKIEDEFKSQVYLGSAYMPDVTTDDDVELALKTALDDIVKQDKAFVLLVDEINKLEVRCAAEKEQALIDRQATLDSINDLNSE